MGKRLNLTNGVSFGGKYTVTAADVTAGAITFDFYSAGGSAPVKYDIAANFLVTTAAGVNVPLADAVISYPAQGQVTLTKGTTFLFVAGQIISVVAQRSVAVV